MKKRLSLFVAMLMVLTLVPFNAFAIKEKLPAVPEVGSSDGLTTGFTYEIESQDVSSVNNVLTTGCTVSVSLGDGAYFKTASLYIGTKKLPLTTGLNKLGFPLAKTASSDEVVDLGVKTVYFDTTGVTSVSVGNEVRLEADIQLDNAAAGDQTLNLRLSPLGLADFNNKVYAKVSENGGFAKAEKAKVLTRGKDQEVAVISVKTKPGEWIAVKPADKDGFSINTINFTNIKVGTKNSYNEWHYAQASGSESLILMTVDVNKDASKGDVEFDVYKFLNDPTTTKPKFGQELDSNSVVAAEYKDYGLTLKTRKSPQSVLANGKEYKVDLTLSTDDNSNLPKYIDFTVEGGNVKIDKTAEYTGDAVGKFDDNFTMDITNWDTKSDKKFSLKVKADWDCNGDVVLKGKARGGEEVECVLLTARPVAKLVIESKDVLNGSRYVDVNDVVIEETEPGALKTGEDFAISLTPLKFYDVKFENKGEITAENIKVDGLTLDKESETIYFTVKSRTKEAAKITISGIQIASRSSLPLGEHKLSLNHVDATEIRDKKLDNGTDYVYGKDWERALDFIADAPYMNIVNELGRVKKTTVFTLGSADYTVDGVAMQLDAPVFTQDNYTMLPVRAVADALGVNVLWNAENRTATFVDGDKVVSVKIGAKTLYKNGIAYPMATKASVKAERMYIPISSVGDAFGLNRDVDYTWNESTKQVTIYPQAAPEKAAPEKADK